MPELLYRCFTKATTAESGSPRFSPNWAVARRAWFKVFEDRVECGDWTIPSAEIDEVVLYKTQQGILSSSVLMLRTPGTSYQFGFNPWCKVGRHLPFGYREERVKMRYSVVSVVVRVAVLAYLGYRLWLWLS